MARVAYGSTRTYSCKECGSVIHSEFRLLGDSRQHWGSPLVYCKTCGNAALIPDIMEPAIVKRKEVEEQLAKRPIPACIFGWLLVLGILIMIVSFVGESMGVRNVSLLFAIIFALFVICVFIWYILKERKAVKKADRLIEESMERLKNVDYCNLLYKTQGIHPDSPFAKHLDATAMTPPMLRFPKDVI